MHEQKKEILKFKRMYKSKNYKTKWLNKYMKINS